MIKLVGKVSLAEYTKKLHFFKPTRLILQLKTFFHLVEDTNISGSIIEQYIEVQTGITLIVKFLYW
jgi:hypothetical protein